MFIELTDHLRCPAEHEEAFLVLLPERLEGRSVRAGTLGCPVCDRRFTLRDGVLDTGGAPPPGAGVDPGKLTPEALAPLVGLNGPGGYLVLVGPPAGGWREVAALVPGVGLVAVNPPPEVVDEEGISVLRGGTLALKANSMRGVVLGAPFGANPAWVREAARTVLPGLRVVGEGPDPAPRDVDLMASAGGVWVGSRRR
ncbi:MAG TPA: hypothetical protein VFN40_02610 [Gemmatimonadales bacterium]|nr:hypothetical protein [Gemmatimonadales bacterium]